jgi:excisionase family DNA binding protein
MKAMLRSIRFSAEALGVSPFTIRRLIAAGQIQAVNIGARRLIPEAEIERVAAHGVGRSKPKSSKKTTVS